MQIELYREDVKLCKAGMEHEDAAARLGQQQKQHMHESEQHLKAKLQLKNEQESAESASKVLLVKRDLKGAVDATAQAARLLVQINSSECAQQAAAAKARQIIPCICLAAWNLGQSMAQLLLFRSRCPSLAERVTCSTCKRLPEERLRLKVAPTDN